MTDKFNGPNDENRLSDGVAGDYGTIQRLYESFKRLWKFSETDETGPGSSCKDFTETSGVLLGFTDIRVHLLVTITHNVKYQLFLWIGDALRRSLQ